MFASNGEMAEATAVNNLDEKSGEKEAVPWYADSKYDRFWAHYNKMNAWMNSHKYQMRTGASPFQEFAVNSWLQLYHQYYQNYQWWMYCNQQHHISNQRHHPYSSTFSHNQQASWSQGGVYPGHQQYQKSKHPHSHHMKHLQPSTGSYRGNIRYVTDQSDVDYLDNGPIETPLVDEEEQEANGAADASQDRFMEQGELEVELSEEMRAFFLQSQKHREELREMRLELSKKQDRGEEESTSTKQMENMLDYEDEFVAKGPSSKKSKKKMVVGAPSEQPGKRRAEEMKILYGKDSPAIHGMETAIQMQFDRNCDKKQPSYWPTVPLKM